MDINASKRPREMTDEELVQAWNALEDDDLSSERADALALELEARQVKV
jgi:hypothetical protein